MENKLEFEIEFSRENIEVIKILTNGRLGRLMVPRSPEGVMIGRVYTSDDYDPSVASTLSTYEEVIEGNIISYKDGNYEIYEQLWYCNYNK